MVSFVGLQAQQLLGHFRTQREGVAGKKKKWHNFTDVHKLIMLVLLALGRLQLQTVSF